MLFYKMKYISLFSGIGGFEVAIHNIFPEAMCIGYSEIDKDALTVYNNHFPYHLNLGDITTISNRDITNLLKKQNCDLIVAGFPCKNLSSLSGFVGDRSGLKGKQSGLFWDLLRIIRVIVSICPEVDIIIENNASMNNKSKKEITDCLTQIKPFYFTPFNNAEIGVQTRSRIFWTTFKVNKSRVTMDQTWLDVLDSPQNVLKYKVKENTLYCLNRTLVGSNKEEKYRVINLRDNGLCNFMYIKGEKRKISRWQLSFISDNMTDQKYTPYPLGKSRPIITSAGTNNLIIDRRFGNDQEFIVRHITPIEKERLFGFPAGWTLPAKSNTSRGNLLGNTVCVKIIEKILDNL